MGRILGVDLGARRVGLALSDPLQTFGSPLGTIPFISLKTLTEQIARVCAERQVDLVVIGMPYEADGREGEGCARARRVARNLEAQGLATDFQDETWTSREAQSALRAAGKTRRTSKETVDMVAASLILRDYLARAAGGEKPDA